jgi:hypothetical protein
VDGAPALAGAFSRFMGVFRGGFGKSACWRVVFCVQRVVKRMVNVDGGLSFCTGQKKHGFQIYFRAGREEG